MSFIPFHQVAREPSKSSMTIIDFLHVLVSSFIKSELFCIAAFGFKDTIVEKISHGCNHCWTYRSQVVH
ncbi:unnamed protein product [Arabidopsis lyrata]|nr:unnamed protein product [Arabidopsis lyrata]